MILDLLPTRTAGAAENMAADFLLLQRYPSPAHARFRHYDWRAPAFTFGYSQKIAYVRHQLAVLAPGLHLDLTRRPTGGGIVDHRDDWTFALVIPRGHALYDARATESYRQVHGALAAALRDQAQPAVLKEHCEPAAEGTACEPAPTVCFIRPELHDVLHADTGRKIAGAAQKRTKHGLLFQGSIAKPALAPSVDWDAFSESFAARLAALLAGEAAPTPWPDFAEGEHDGLADHYSAPEWIEHR